jgi:GR25 family glycosyltransferase involved in LPS biosynthesis
LDSVTSFLSIACVFLLSLPEPWGSDGHGTKHSVVHVGEQCLAAILQTKLNSSSSSLSFIPLPMSGSSSGTDHGPYLASRRLLAPSLHTNSGSTTTKHFISSSYRLYQHQRRLPALVINLDRRSDRWRRVCLSCEAHGVLPVRISAIDGLKVSQLEAKTAGSIAVIATTDDHGLKEATRELVSREDVTLVWDSTLNARFDRHCVISATTPMTDSERACAASHLHIWRMLSTLRMVIFEPLEKKSIAVQSNSSSSSSSSSSTVPISALSSVMQNMATVFGQSWFAGGWTTLSLPKFSPAVAGVLPGGRLDTDWYLIMEDDASFVTSGPGGLRARPLGSNINTAPGDDFLSDFQQRVNELLCTFVPGDFDVFYLGYTKSTESKLVPVNKHVAAIDYVWMLHAYILRGRAINKLMNKLPINAPVDNFVAQLVYDGVLKVGGV